MSSCWHGHAAIAGLSWARGKETQEWLVGQVHPCPFIPAVCGCPISYGTPSSIALICLSLSASVELCFAAAIIPFAFWVCADAVHLFTQQL